MSSNPALSDKILKRETETRRSDRGTGFDPSWGRPSDDLPPGVFSTTAAGSAGYTTTPPGGPVIDRGDTMRVGGALTATAVLLVITAVAFVFGWQLTSPTYEILADGTRQPTVDIPGWLILLALASFGVALLNSFKPRLSVVAGPLYAGMMGVFAGAISHAFEAHYEGIVVQAVAATVAVFTAMLGLYATRVIRVTDRMRSTIVAAMGGIAILYLVSIGLGFFGVRVPFIHDASPIGILLSIAICGIAAFSLLLDFDFIERGAEMGAPRYMEWYAAFGLMASILWLYIEILRLLAKLRER